MVQKFSKKLLFLSTLSACLLNAGTITVDADGSAEANPDLYVYSFTISASCYDSDTDAETKVTQLEDALSKAVTPFLKEGVEVESQYYTTSNNLPEQYSEDQISYQNNPERKVTCDAGKWYYSSSAVFKLLNVEKRKEFQKAITKLTAASNVLNAGLELNKKTSGVNSSSATPSLMPETTKALFAKAYEDAKKNAEDKLNVINSKSFYSSSFRLSSVVENPKDQFGGGRSYAFAAAAMDVSGGAANPGVQKLKLTVSYRFTATNN